MGIEICEDLWVPLPPSSLQAMAGATILLNISASNETIGKSRYRTDLVVGQSGRAIAAYAMAGAGPSESTTDVVFGGHCLIAENGRLLAESPRVGDGQPVRRDSYRDHPGRRRRQAAGRPPSHDELRRCLSQLAKPFRRIAFSLAETMDGLEARGARHSLRTSRRAPSFTADVPKSSASSAPAWPSASNASRPARRSTSASRAASIPRSPFWSPSPPVTCSASTAGSVHGLTMPGFGTTQRTRTNALALMEHLGVSSETIDISALALRTFQEMGHCPSESIAAARRRVVSCRAGRVPEKPATTSPSKTFRPGCARSCSCRKGSSSAPATSPRQALGWSTYNGDHMSMYNPNCSIPKTLVKFLVKYVALHQFPEGPARQTLLSIVETTISPELLPASLGGEIEQSTEATLGPFELHDFILYHAVRCGYPPEKILFLSRFATFTKPFPPELFERTMKTFFERFFHHQYKRSCVPDGPKVGTVSLSPRGDWRMPSDAEPPCGSDGNA